MPAESQTSTGASAWERLPRLVVYGAALVLAARVASGPQLYDAGELAAAAVDLGGSHPPGQPLHALLGQLFTWLPLGGLPARLALLSAVCALGAAVVAGRLCAELCAELGVPEGRWRYACETAAALGVLLALPVLRQTLRVEVYTLALLLFLAAVFALFRWAREGRPRWLWSAALLAGLDACVHPPHALAIALTAGCLCAFSPRRLLRSPRVVALAIASGLLGLLVLVYLPLRARAGAPMWGEPQTLAGFWSYVSGQAFLANVAAQNRFALFADYGDYLLSLNTGAPFVGATILLWPQVHGGSRAVQGIVLAAAAALLAACLQPLEARNPDNVAYLGPALALGVIAGVAGFASLAQRGHPALAGLGLCLVAVPPASAGELVRALRADVPALETLDGMRVAAPPPRALVVMTNDFAAASFMMARSVDRVRPDLALFVSGLSTSSWHWAQLGAHAGLDPKPRRGPGGDAHDGYTRGVVQSALSRVPVVLENDFPWLPPRTTVLGPYLLLDPLGAPAARHVDGALADRWFATLARDAELGPAGDYGAAHATVRYVLWQRSRRLFALGLGEQAVAVGRSSLWQLPAEQRGSVRVPRGARSERMPYMLDDAESYLISGEDAVRQAAAELWALGQQIPAVLLLERQLARGDPYSLIQLAHLQAFDGQRDLALRTLAGLDAVEDLPAAVRAQRERLQSRLKR